ncbi:anti-repressor SinI family protein [Priestia megaterium]
MLKEDNKFDQEWIGLMKEAYHLGLSIVEVKEFIYSKQKELVSKWYRLFLLLIIHIMITRTILLGIINGYKN